MEMELENRISESQFENTSTKVLNLLIKEIHNAITKHDFKDRKVSFISLDITSDNILNPVIKAAVETKQERLIEERTNDYFDIEQYEVIDISLRKRVSSKDTKVIKDYFNHIGKDADTKCLEILADISQELNTYDWKKHFNIDTNFVIFIAKDKKTNIDLMEISVPFFKHKNIIQ